MVAAHQFHGHAIVSDNDMIADAAGNMPDALMNASDWARFQHELDKAVAVVLGRKGHLAHRNIHRRNRIVVSSSVRAIENHDDAWWWNPADATLEEVLAAAAPGGGIVAIPGGKLVFDLFLKIGYDEFHLARARGVKIENGIPVFSECATGRSAEEVLAGHGLVPSPADVLDGRAAVAVTIWHRQPVRI
jgi:dihydrofolate reductase